jgi:peptidoglycan/xylan/chitin deacetylase (PgdA/CDA1 family)
MKYFISFDDYCIENYKVTKLLLKYDLFATFFIELEKNGDRRKPFEQIKAISDMGFDIGCHSIDHTILRDVNSYEQDLQIIYAKSLVESVTGKSCTWYCPPKGRYDDTVINKILNAGFTYIRTVDVLDTDDIVEGINKTTIHVYPRKEYKGIDWLTRSNEYIDYGTGTFKLWAHGWEVEKYDNWNKLEQVLERLGAIVGAHR